MYKVGDTVEADLFPDGAYGEPKWLRCEVVEVSDGFYLVRVVDERVSSAISKEVTFGASRSMVRDAA